MTIIFGYISACLSILSVIPYIRDIFLLKTKPERASWFIWSVLGFIAFFSQLAKGATDSLWLTIGQTLAVFAVFSLSIKFGYGGLTRRDIKALIGAGVGLVLWYLTSEPAWALLLVIIVDSMGTLLTVIKSYEDPQSETFITWVVSGVSGIFGALAVGTFSTILLAYPLYIFVANFAVVGALLLGRKKM